MRIGTLVAVSALWVGCGAGGDPEPRILTGTLVVDREFSPEQRADVMGAIDMWRAATLGRFAPAVVLGEVECGQAFAIEAVHDEGCHVGQRVEDEHTDLEQRVLGAVDRDSHWVSVVTWLEGSDFRHNVAHELGHYMLIGHGEGIMAQAREQQPARVAASSISEFCAVWGCARQPADDPSARP